jgi:2-oxoglutarate ferredoxin oxidoreductase subunit gamma
VKPDGLIVFDSSVIGDVPSESKVERLSVPAAKLAHELGDLKVANVIVLGALIGKTPFLKETIIHSVLDEYVGNENLRALNRKAFEVGRLHSEVRD